MIYYLLVEKIEQFGWAIQFGDYDRDTVRDERDDLVLYSEVSGRNLKIIAAKSDMQIDCDAAVAALNAKEG